MCCLQVGSFLTVHLVKSTRPFVRVIYSYHPCVPQTQSQVYGGVTYYDTVQQQAQPKRSPPRRSSHPVTVRPPPPEVMATHSSFKHQNVQVVVLYQNVYFSFKAVCFFPSGPEQKAGGGDSFLACRKQGGCVSGPFLYKSLFRF